MLLPAIKLGATLPSPEWWRGETDSIISGICQLSSVTLASYFSALSPPPGKAGEFWPIWYWHINFQSENLWLWFQSTSKPARGHMSQVVACKTKVFQSLHFKEKIPKKNTCISIHITPSAYFSQTQKFFTTTILALAGWHCCLKHHSRTPKGYGLDPWSGRIQKVPDRSFSLPTPPLKSTNISSGKDLKQKKHFAYYKPFFPIWRFWIS